MNIYYVYAYIDALTGLPYYIGKGKDRRAYQKHRDVTVPTDTRYIVIISSGLTEFGAFAIERRMIRWYGRKNNRKNPGILENKSSGGNGGWGTSGRGTPKSAEHRSKLSTANKGKTKTAEHRRKIGESNKGYRASEETRRKLSEAHKGKPSSRKGIPLSEETKRKMSEAAKRRVPRNNGKADLPTPLF